MVPIRIDEVWHRGKPFRSTQVGSAFVPPGQPWRNGYVAFNSRIRDECLNMNLFWSLTHARVVISD